MSAAERRIFGVLDPKADPALIELALPERAARLRRLQITPVEDFIASKARPTAATLTIAHNDVVIEERTPISNQFAIGSCVANAVMDAMELLMPARNVRQLSRLFAYWVSRRSHGDDCRDDGTYIRACFEEVRDVGVCLESTYPYDGRAAEDGGRVNDRPTLAAYNEAYDHRIEAFRAIRGTPKRRILDVKAAIDNKQPVVVAFALGNEWNDVDARDVAHGAPVRITGHHAMVIVGYRELADGTFWFLIRNSWGTGWGRKGYAWVTADYVGSALHCTELYAATLAPII